MPPPQRVFESQEYKLFQWKPVAGGAWSIASGAKARGVCPAPGWSPVSTSGTDGDGWVYAADFKRIEAGEGHPQARRSDYVRRRIWMRAGPDGTVSRPLAPAKPADDFTYVTDRLLVMGYPGGARSSNPLTSCAARLRQQHGGHFAVFNLSEVAYDAAPFEGCVVGISCPGYPAPPLHTLFELCFRVQRWFEADARNVAVVHCRSGHGRSNIAAACLLQVRRRRVGRQLAATGGNEVKRCLCPRATTCSTTQQQQ
jgi:hypothetical protein